MTETLLDKTVMAPTVAEANGRKRTKFLADLTRAMRAAADEAREQAMTQFQADVTQHVDAAHRQAESAAVDAKNRAEEDINGLREWSKAEIARIKQETEDGITHRRERLDGELADQNAGLELELERVQGRVKAFEGEMDAFFQRLAQEEDPTRFAGLAEQLPEPPSFDTWRPEITIAATAPDPDPDPEMTARPAVEPAGPSEMVEAMAAPSAAPEMNGPAVETPTAVESQPEAPQAQAEEQAAPVVAESFDAAEAEAAVDWAAAEEQAETKTEPDQAPAATGEAWQSPTPEITKTQVAVVGLVSVASIATFKRLLSRAPGINAVQVASGPDGEFVFSATHEVGCDVPAAVASLKDFEVQILEASPGQVNAKAVDPEVQ